MALTQSQIDTEINTTLPSGKPGGILAADVRTVLHDINAAVFSGTGTSVSTIAAMQGIVSPHDGDEVYVTDPLTGGPFVFETVDHSIDVLHDPGRGIFASPLAPGDPTGAGGAWKRRYSGPERLSWWGVKSDAKVIDPFGLDMLQTNVIATSVGATYGAGAVVRLQVVSTAGIATGDYCYVNNVTGTTQANGSWNVTVIDPTHIDLSHGSGTSTGALWGSGPVGSGGIVQDGATAGPHILPGFTDNTQMLSNWQVWAIYRSAKPSPVFGAASSDGGTTTTLTIGNAWPLLSGETVTVVGVAGSGGFNPNGTWTATFIDGTHIKIPYAFPGGGAWTSGGFVHGSRGGHDIHVMADDGTVCWRSGGTVSNITNLPQFDGSGQFSGLSVGLATTNYLWVAGILNLTVECDNGNCSFQNTLDMAHGASSVGVTVAFPSRGTGAAGYNTSYLINQTVPGTRTFSFVNPADAAHVYLGQRVVLTSFDTQYLGGPPNPQYYEFHEVSGIDVVNGIVRVVDDIQYEHRTDFPDFNLSGPGYAIGRARMWIPYGYWGRYILKNIGCNAMVGYLNDPQTPNVNYANVSGFYVETNNWRGVSFSESGAQSIIHYNSIENSIGETDKTIDSLTRINCQNKYSGMSLQSPCPKRLILDGGDYAALVGLGQNVVAKNTYIGLLQMSCAYGYSAGGIFSGCKITKVSSSGIIDGSQLCPIGQNTVVGVGAGAINPAGGNYVRLTVINTSQFQVTGAQGYMVNVSGVQGTGTLPAATNGVWSVFIVDGTHIDLVGSTFPVGQTWTSGGSQQVENTAQVKVTGASVVSSHVRLTVPSTKMAVGDTLTIFGIVGAVEANGTQVIFAIPDPTHVDLVLATCSTYVSGGVVQDASLMTITGAVSSTGAAGGLVRITMSAAAVGRLRTGDYIQVAGVQMTGSTVINGTWPVSKFSSTQVDLLGTNFLAGDAYVPGGSFTGSIIGNTLTVSSNTGIAPGQVLLGAGIANGTTILAYNSGTSWAVSIPQTIASEAMTTAGAVQFFSGATFADGVISLSKAGMSYALSLTWSAWVPGQFFGVQGQAGYNFAVSTYSGLGMVRQITEDPINIYIITDLPYETLPSWALANAIGYPQVFNFRVGDVRFDNCWGGPHAKAFSLACARGHAYYEDVEYTFSDPVSASLTYPSGEITALEINVFKPSPTTWNLQLLTADVRSGLVLDGAGQGLQISINGSVTGKRRLTEDGSILLSGDTFTVAGSGAAAIPLGRIVANSTILGGLVSNYYMSPIMTVRYISDGGIARRGLGYLKDASGNTLVTMKGTPP